MCYTGGSSTTPPHPEDEPGPPNVKASHRDAKRAAGLQRINPVVMFLLRGSCQAGAPGKHSEVCAPRLNVWTHFPRRRNFDEGSTN
eukprot:607331-Pyramimonas_sp.AAC.2